MEPFVSEKQLWVGVNLSPGSQMLIVGCSFSLPYGSSRWDFPGSCWTSMNGSRQ